MPVIVTLHRVPLNPKYKYTDSSPRSGVIPALISICLRGGTDFSC